MNPFNETSTHNYNDQIHCQVKRYTIYCGYNHNVLALAYSWAWVAPATVNWKLRTCVISTITGSGKLDLQVKVTLA